MGNVGSIQIGSTFDNAFRRPVSSYQQQGQTLEASNQAVSQKPLPQQTQTQSTKEESSKTVNKNTTTYNDQYLGNTYSLNMNNLKPIVDKSNQVIVDTVTTEPKSNKDKLKAAGIIVGAAGAIGATTLLLTKGKATKKLTSFLTEQSQNLTQMIDIVKSDPRLANKSTIKLTLLQGLSKGLMMARGLVFNTTPLKDVLFDKIVCDYLHLRKP